MLIALAGWGAYRYLDRPKPIPVVVAVVDRGLVESTVVNTRAGTVKTCRRARLSPMVGGIIARWPVREGMRVKKGDLLLALWNDDLAARRTLTEREIDAAEAEADAACRGAETAAATADRYQRLGNTGAAAAETIDRATGDAAVKAASCRAARAAVAVKRQQLAVLDAELAKTRLYAPFDGIVAELNGELGEYLTPSPPGIQTLPAVDLIDPSCFYVVAPIDEVDASLITVGMAARITLDAFRDRTFPGTVRRIADYVLDREKQARTVDVEVTFTDPAAIPMLLAGYSADAEIVLAGHDGVVRVPTEAIQDDQRVFVEKNGRLQAREVVTGLANWRYTEILEGLAPGDRVVTSLDREGIADGALVVVEETVGAR